MPKVETLTTLRAGTLGDHPDNARDEMFIDPSPYLSLRGVGLGKDWHERYGHDSKNPRAPTDPGDAARARSRGVAGGTAPLNNAMTVAATKPFGRTRRRRRS